MQVATVGRRFECNRADHALGFDLVDFVRLADLNGFTGSYEHALQGEATVTMTGPTYHITGAALGFNKATGPADG